MISLLTTTEEKIMSSQGKSPDDKRARANTKTNIESVTPDSLQTRAPGAAQKGSANVQSASVEQEGTSMRDRGSLQGSLDEDVGSQRGGAGAQQAGWSARQKGERMSARAEEDRQGLPQQSGYGGLEQKQHAGSQESVTGPKGSRQSARPDEQLGSLNEPPSDAGSRRTKRTPQR
jgi:hypothetical protein